MTIPSSPRKAGPFNGTGSQTAWPFAFKVFAASDVKVTAADAEGTETVLVLGTDYSVTLNPNQETSPGGTVIYPISGFPLPAGGRLTVTGDLPYDQTLDIPSGGNFSPLALENQLDRTTMQVQQLAEEVERAVKVPVTEGEGGQLSADLAQGILRLADSADNIDTVANNMPAVASVADNVAGVNTVASNIGNVAATGANIAAVVTVANDLNEPVSEIDTVATNIADVNTVGQNIAVVSATAANLSAIGTVAANISDVSTVAENVADVTNFADVYYGPRASDPTTRNDGSASLAGDLYFNTGSKRTRVFDGTAWVEGTTAPGTTTVDTFSGTGAQTVFTLSVAPVSKNNTLVFIGGVYQQPSEYSVVGTTLTFTAAPPAGFGNVVVSVNSPFGVGVTDAAYATFNSGRPSARLRSVSEKLTEKLSVNDYSGANANAQAQAMISDVGFARFTRGAYVVSSDTFSAPLVFEDGAYLDVAAGNTLTITHLIQSPKQWIFRGDGNVSLTHDNTENQGEYARQVHVSWFGAFPEPNPVVVPDHAVHFNRAYQAMGNVREGILQMDMGTYYWKTPVVATRGTHLRGEGTRRTAIRAAADAFDLLTTGNTACRFSEFGFENYGSLVRTSGSYINVQHSSCEIYNVNLPTAKNGIRSIGNDLRIKNVIGSFGAAFADSSIVKIEGGSNIEIEDVIYGSSSNFGPSYVVDITNRDSGQAISAVTVRNIKSIMPAPLVNIEARLANISQVDIDGVIGTSFQGTIPEQAIHVQAHGGFSVKFVPISGVLCNSYYRRFLKVTLTTGGLVEGVTIDASAADGGTGLYGVQVVGEAGTTLKNSFFSGSFINNREFDYDFTQMLGAITNVNVDPNARANTNPAICTGFVINDDAVATIPLNRAVNNGFLMVSVGYQNYMTLAIRAASSPQATVINASANMGTAVTSLNGTTGPDAKFTVGITNGVLYLENRLGSAQSVTAVLMTGVQ